MLRSNRCGKFRTSFEQLEPRTLLTNGVIDAIVQTLSPAITGDFRSPAPAHPVVTYHGGPILDKPIIVPIVVGAAPGDPYSKAMLAALSTIATGSYLDGLLTYGFRGRENVIIDAPDYVAWNSKVAFDQTSQYLTVANEQHARPGQSGETLFVLIAGPNIAVTKPGPNNTTITAGYTTFGGYHGNTDAGLYYAIVADIGEQTGAPVTMTDPYPEETITMSHELVESISNPDAATGWFDNAERAPDGSILEIGDLCETPNKNGVGGKVYGDFRGYSVQWYWTNHYEDQPTFGGFIHVIRNSPCLPADYPVEFSLAGESFGPNANLTVFRTVTPSSGRFSGIVGSFYDGQDQTPDPARYDISIDWGDGQSSTGVASYNTDTGCYDVTGSHIYTLAPGAVLELAISVQDRGTGAGANIIQPASLTDAPLNADGVNVASQEGAVFADSVATFENFANLPVIDRIDWGDGSPQSSGTVTGPDLNGRFSLQGQHVYVEEGHYTITTTIAVGTSPGTVVTSTAAVVDPPIVGSPIAGINAFEGVSATLSVATFVDPGGPEIPVADYSATINWGDNSSSVGTVGASDPTTGVFTVSGVHMYANEGSFNIAVTINHEATTPIEVDAVVQVSDNLGILLLDRTSTASFVSSGNGGVAIAGAGTLIIDSNNAHAGIQSGDGLVTAAEIDVAGKLTHSGNGGFVGTVEHEAATPDPLASLAAPLATGPVFKNKTVNNKSIVLAPGTYVDGLHINGNSKVTLSPGIYFLQGGGLTLTGGSKLLSDGVMIYNDAKNNGDQINLSGTASMTLSAPTSGAYQGIVLFQKRSSTAPVVLSGGGSKSRFSLTGVVYVPGAQVIIGGGGNSVIHGDAANGISGALIAKDLNKSGDGRLTVDASANAVSGSLPFLFVPTSPSPSPTVRAQSVIASASASGSSVVESTKSLAKPTLTTTASMAGVTTAVKPSPAGGTGKIIIPSAALDAVFGAIGA